MAIASVNGDGRELSANALRLYGACAIRNAEQVAVLTTQHPEAHAELVDWGLITPDQPADTVPAVRDPKNALQRRFDDVLSAAEKQVALLKTLPALEQQLSHAYDSVQLRIPGTASVYLDDPDVVNARLQDVVSGARREILAAQPGGPRDQALLDIAMPRDVAALDRGVTMRTIYRDTVRDHGPTAAYAAQMTNRGPGRSARYRTMPGTFERMIIVDGETAVVPDYIVAESPPHAAWIITDPASVVMLARGFEATWMRAQPWMGQLRARRGDARDTIGSSASAMDGVRTTRRQREIMRNLCAGAQQTTVAKRIGVSKRTLEDEVAALKVLWGVGTMNELIFQYAQSPDCRVDDSAPADQPAGAEYETTA